MNEENWYPSEEEYTPNLSKDDWIRLLQDEKIFDYNSMCLMRRMKDIGGQATCKQLADKYGKTPSAYVGIVSALTKRIQQKAKCTEPPQRENGNERRWPILFLGKRDNDNIHYIWKLRPELSAALDEIDLAKYELYTGKTVEIEGLWTRDNGDWKDKLLTEIAQAKSKYAVIWWHNQPSGWTDKNVKKFLENLIADESGFWIYYVANNFVTHRAHIIDFSEKDEYKNHVTDWNQKNPLWFSKNFEDYYDDTRSAFVSFLADKFEVIDEKDSFSADCFQEYYKTAIRTNMVAYKYITQGDATMPNPNDKIISLMDLLEANRNLILHGAPGTGKTHTAKDIAKAMGCTDDEIGFVQFHPSYDYTDFVEGLRPDPDNDGSKDVSFIRMDGVFKEFCKRTLSKQKITKGNFDDAYEKFIEEIVENEEFSLNTKSRNKKFMLSLNSKNSVCVTAIDGNSSMCITKERIKQYIETGKTNWYIYTEPIGDYIKEKYNIKVEQKVETNEKKKFVFIIDEINRGEISKIFGELFFSIDPGYRGEKGRVLTQYQNLVTEYDEHGNEDPFTKDKGGFFVPENVYIIGTMNDIDRSVESMDFAFRRRFVFKEVSAEESAENMGITNPAMKRINDEIAKPENELGKDYQLGGAYFLDDMTDQERWDLKISRLIKEYLRGIDPNGEKFQAIENAYFGKNQVAEKQDDEHQDEASD